jgi:hypothetical protein
LIPISNRGACSSVNKQSITLNNLFVCQSPKQIKPINNTENIQTILNLNSYGNFFNKLYWKKIEKLCIKNIGKID